MEPEPGGPGAAVSRESLLAETARIPWRDLQRFFAKGQTLAVSEGLDLVEVAWQLSADNAVAVEEWIDAEQLGAVSDAQAAQWYQADATVWSVVVAPWVLVQPLSERERTPGATMRE